MKRIRAITSMSCFVLFLFLIGTTDAAYSAEKSWVISNVDGGAWKSMSSDYFVKKSLKAGDAISRGDKIDIYPGNKIRALSSADSQNALHVAGSFEVKESSTQNTNIELLSGKITSVLDSLPSGHQFKISTPTAIASVRGTRFLTETSHAGTRVATFEGRVVVNRKMASGNVSSTPYLVEEGDEVFVPSDPKKPVYTSKVSSIKIEQLKDLMAEIQKDQSKFAPKRAPEQTFDKSQKEDDQDKNIDVDRLDYGSILF